MIPGLSLVNPDVVVEASRPTAGTPAAGRQDATPPNPKSLAGARLKVRGGGRERKNWFENALATQKGSQNHTFFVEAKTGRKINHFRWARKGAATRNHTKNAHTQERQKRYATQSNQSAVRYSFQPVR